jgi:hypothetical protein
MKEYYKVPHVFLDGIETPKATIGDLVVTSLTALSTYFDISKIEQITSEFVQLTGNLQVDGLFKAGNANIDSLTARRIIGGTNSFLLNNATNSFILGSNIRANTPNTTFIENLSVLGKANFGSAADAAEIKNANIDNLTVNSISGFNADFYNAKVFNLDAFNILFRDPFNPGFTNILVALSALLNNKFEINTFTVAGTSFAFVQPGELKTLNFAWNHTKVDPQGVKEFTFFYNNTSFSGNWAFKNINLDFLSLTQGISTFSVSGTDYYGASAEKSLKVTNVGLIYYGVTPTLNPSEQDIYNNFTEERHSDKLAHKINFDCTGGKYFFIAYPTYFNYVPITIFDPFELVYEPARENYFITLTNSFGAQLQYRVLLSNELYNSDNVFIEYKDL